MISAVDVSCPYCAAAPGNVCKTASGVTRPVHADRKKAMPVHRVEVDRFVPTLRGGTERRDLIAIVSDCDCYGATVAQAAQPFDPDLDVPAAIRRLGWELVGELRETVAGPRHLEGRVRAVTAQTSPA